MSKRTNVKQMILTALMAVLLVVCSWLSVPWAIPFTMQTFGVWFAFLFLGAGRGTAAVLLYLVLGLVGLPVYAGGAAGAGVLFGPHGGYMLGWLAAGLVMWLFEKVFGDRKWSQISAMLTGLLLCYAAGTTYFVVTYAHGAESMGIGAALMTCVVPFVLPDLLKLALAYWLNGRLRRTFQRGASQKS